MVKVLFILLILASIIVVSGCTSTGQLTGGPNTNILYQCSNGTIVTDVHLCQTTVPEDGGALNDCSRANLVIKKAVYTAETGKITLMIYNPSTMPLKSFRVKVTYNKGFYSSEGMEERYYIERTVNPNTYQTFYQEITSNDIDFIEVESLECRGVYDMIRSYDVVGLTQTKYRW